MFTTKLLKGLTVTRKNNIVETNVSSHTSEHNVAFPKFQTTVAKLYKPMSYPWFYNISKHNVAKTIGRTIFQKTVAKTFDC